MSLALVSPGLGRGGGVHLAQFDLSGAFSLGSFPHPCLGLSCSFCKFVFVGFACRFVFITNRFVQVFACCQFFCGPGVLFSYQPASAPIAQLDWAIGARAIHQLLLLFVNLCNGGSVVFWGFCGVAGCAFWFVGCVCWWHHGMVFNFKVIWANPEGFSIPFISACAMTSYARSSIFWVISKMEVCPTLGQPICKLQDAGVRRARVTLTYGTVHVC